MIIYWLWNKPDKQRESKLYEKFTFKLISPLFNLFNLQTYF